jgi:cytochrome c oxidase subunit 2
MRARHLAASLPLAACAGPQSALVPAGRSAERIADLFWWMTAGAAVIWLAVVALTVYAVVRERGRSDDPLARRLVVAGGVVPTVILTGLLAYGLAMLPALLAPAVEGGTTITVVAEQYWWRVRYETRDGTAIDLANEIRLEADVPVELRLESRDVIHSFWIPALGGKVDMIPGRRTHLTLEPTTPGEFRGVCAEYCGASHAWMSFSVVVQPDDDFADWLAHQAEPARIPVEPLAVRGRAAFSANGCGACHSVRGTSADGVVGPDLTHVGSRGTVGAGRFPNDEDGFLQWITAPELAKPGVHMPAFGMLRKDELRALAAYLESLQ